MEKIQQIKEKLEEILETTKYPDSYKIVKKNINEALSLIEEIEKKETFKPKHVLFRKDWPI